MHTFDALPEMPGPETSSPTHKVQEHPIATDSGGTVVRASVIHGLFGCTVTRKKPKNREPPPTHCKHAPTCACRIPNTYGISGAAWPFAWYHCRTNTSPVDTPRLRRSLSQKQGPDHPGTSFQPSPVTLTQVSSSPGFVA